MKRYPRTLTFFAGSIFLTLFGAISTISAQQRVPADFIEQQRNNAKKEIADLRTTQDINLLKAFIINWQNQDNVKSRIVAAYIEEIKKDFAPFIELFNQEAGQQIILSQHAQELADSLAHDQGRLFTQKLAQLIKEHGISLLFTALLVDENNVHLRTFFDTAIQENAIFTALPGQAEQEIAVFHLVAHLVKHQQRR